MLRQSGMAATVLRPWYMLGRGHRWPVVLAPVYWICERISATRAGARRWGLVSLSQMICALVATVEQPPLSGVRVVEVPEIRAATIDSDWQKQFSF